MSAPPISRIPRLVQKRNSLKRTPSAPSKLELLRDQYHQQILMEKEELLMKIFRERQEMVMQRMRAAIQDNKQHIKNTGSLGLKRFENVFDYNGRPMGRDKSTLLAPIKRPAKLPSVDNNSTLPIVAHVPQPPPFKQKPAVVRQNRSMLKQHSSPLMTTEQPQQNNNNQKANISYRNYCKKNESSCEPAETDETETIGWRKSPVDMQELTPFQKWQLMQQKQKEKRLERYREMRNGEAHDMARDFTPNEVDNKRMPIATPPNSQLKRENSLRLMQKKRILHRQNSGNSEVDDDEQGSFANTKWNKQQENPLDDIQRKERELVALIKKEQAELDEIQKMNDDDEDGDDDEDEVMEKENRYIASRSDRRQRLRAASRRAETMSECEEQPMSRNRSRQTEQPSRNERSQTNAKMTARANHRPATRNPTPPPPRKQFTVDPTKEGTAFYIKKSSTADATCNNLDMEECNICGRTFATDRLARHTAICEKNSKKKRKVFDLVKMRTEGTDQAKYVKHMDSQPPKKKNLNWRQKHEDLMKSLHHARQSSQLEAAGKRPLPAPPTHNPDYIQCESCGRRFNEAAAARHIPRCRDIKSRAAAPGAYRRQR